MGESDLNEQLRAITSRFFDAPRGTLLTSYGAPFDISKPNLHDNKPDFIAERNAVEEGMKSVSALIKLFASRYDEQSELQAVSENICAEVDRNAWQRLRVEVPNDIPTLLRNNAASMGITHITIFFLIEIQKELAARKQELADQEEEFWSGKSRPPNHYARTIALRFARLVAQNTGKKPTVGRSRDGNHPSTDFGRAIEEIFQLLGIGSDFRRAADWAVEQLKEEDFNPPQNSLGRLMALGPSGSTQDANKRAIVEALMKKVPER